MERARAVVVGGGITGTSVAYHLAKAGWGEVVLLEKDELTSGSTCHAAGLVTQFNPSPTMMRFRRYSIELYQELGVFETVGSLRFASSSDQLKELKRGVSRARGLGLEVELVSADEAARLMPVISRESLYGAVWVPGDGHLDPHTATHALAAAARKLGARVLTHRRVTGVGLSPSGAIRHVLEHLRADPGARRGLRVEHLVLPIDREQLCRPAGNPHHVALGATLDEVVVVGQSAGEGRDPHRLALEERDLRRGLLSPHAAAR